MFNPRRQWYCEAEFGDSIFCFAYNTIGQHSFHETQMFVFFAADVKGEAFAKGHMNI